MAAFAPCFICGTESQFSTKSDGMERHVEVEFEARAHHRISHLLANPGSSTSTKQHLSLEDIRLEHRLRISEPCVNSRSSHDEILEGRSRQGGGGGRSARVYERNNPVAMDPISYATPAVTATLTVLKCRDDCHHPNNRSDVSGPNRRSQSVTRGWAEAHQILPHWKMSRTKLTYRDFG